MQPTSVREKRRGQRIFSDDKYMYFDYKRGEIHLMTWFARRQCFKNEFCEVDVRNGKTAKRNVWSPKVAIFFFVKIPTTLFSTT
jgi:hypothetical protein